MVLALIASLLVATTDTAASANVPLSSVSLRLKYVRDSTRFAHTENVQNYKKTCPECFRTNRSCGKAHVGDVTWICIDEPEDER